MLADRDYMREPDWRGGRSFTVWLIVANVVIFLVELAVAKFAPSIGFNQLFALSLQGISHGYLWQLLTFQFLHGGWMHLLLNCWALYMFGRELEEYLGRRSFLLLYLFSGVVGGLVQLLCALASPVHFGGYVVGASAGVFGLVAAYAALFPERELTLLLFFIIPVTLRAKMLLLWGAVIAIVGALMASDNVAHAAHLGGMLGGLAFLNLAGGFSGALASLAVVFQRFRPGRAKPSAPISPRWQKLEWDAVRPPRNDGTPTQSNEFMAREVDPILEKIAAHGINSLTAREREILEQARERMAKR